MTPDQQRLWTGLFRLNALEARVEKRNTIAAALGLKQPGPTAEECREAQTLIAEGRAWINAQRMKQEVARARARFLARA
jgi:hypothetical protein